MVVSSDRLRIYVTVYRTYVGPMMQIRRAEERGHADHGWLDSHHSFSFANYYDPAHMGFRNLRVINEDRVAPGEGFGTHPHNDMEIISYVLEGALEHKDSMGTGSVIRPGEVQRMSAGTGVTHSEFNGSKTEPVHFLQIWLLPTERGLRPGYEQKTFSDEEKAGKLCLIASPDGAQGSTTVHSDARVYAGTFDVNQSAELAIAPNRHAWVQVARGRARVNGTTVKAGDGLSFSSEPTLRIDQGERAELLVFDLA